MFYEVVVWALGIGQRAAEGGAIVRVRAEGSMFCRPCILYSANDVTLLIRRYGTSDDRQEDNPFEGVSSVRTSTKEWSCSQDGIEWPRRIDFRKVRAIEKGAPAGGGLTVDGQGMSKTLRTVRHLSE